MKNGDSFELKSPTVHEDSVTGIKWKNDTLTFAMNDIEKISIREYHAGRTGLLILILVGVPVFLILMTATHASYL